jgi:hypothetical protein
MNAATVTTRIRKAIREAGLTTVLFVRTRGRRSGQGVSVWHTLIALTDNTDQQAVADCLGKAFGNITVEIPLSGISMTSPQADGPQARIETGRCEPPAFAIPAVLAELEGLAAEMDRRAGGPCVVTADDVRGRIEQLRTRLSG